MQTSILKGEYGDTVISGPADRPDDPAKWQPRRLSEAETCKRYRASIDELMAWQNSVGFPKPHSKQVIAAGAWGFKVVREWDPALLDAFDARILDVAARVPKG